MDTSKRNHVKSAARSLDILEYLADHPGGTSLKDLHQNLSIPVSSLHNTVMTMVQKGYLARDEANLRYHLGPKIGHLASSYYEQVDLIQLADPYMQRLARLTGETSSLTVLRQNLIVFIHKVVGEGVPQIVNPVGTTLPAHATGSGKVMLAYLPEEDLNRIYTDENLQQFTPKTITSKAMLKLQLKQIALDGFAFDDEESNTGIWAVAGCIRDRHGLPVSSISVVGLAERIFTKNHQEWPLYVRNIAAEMSAALGYRPPELINYTVSSSVTSASDLDKD